MSACQSGLESGDFPYAGYGAATEAWSAWVISRNLDRFVRDFRRRWRCSRSSRCPIFWAAHRVILNWALALQGRTSDALSLSDTTFDERASLKQYEHTAPFFLTFVYTAKLQLCVSARAVRRSARRSAERAEQVAVTGTMWPVLHRFLGRLAAAAAFDTAPERAGGYRDRLAGCTTVAASWQIPAPRTFAVSHCCISPKCKRLTSTWASAPRLFEKPSATRARPTTCNRKRWRTSCAPRHGFARDETRDGGGVHERSLPMLRQWGATAKTAQMEDRYADSCAHTRPLPRPDPRVRRRVEREPAMPVGHDHGPEDGAAPSPWKSKSVASSGS